MTRAPLPNRRFNLQQEVTHLRADGSLQTYIVTFGFIKDGSVQECFCSSSKTGSDIQAMINDSCIAISLLLQHGMTMADLALAFGENRNEHESTGLPSSPLGAIARAGAALDAELA